MRCPTGRTAFLVFALFAAAPADQVFSQQAPSFRVIVNRENPVAAVDRRFLAEAFLKKTTRWPNDQVIHPVDLDPDSEVRHHFSENVLRRSVSAVKSYWQQQIFSGRDVPPPELKSDDAVVKYVVANSGAVGYVSGRANVDGAKVVPVR